MNSERELFEKTMFDNDFMFSQMWHDGEYMDLYTQSMWLAWQASAQRQGYKLVPVVASKRMLKAGYDAHNDFFFDSQVHDVYKAMIGAVDE